MNRSDTPFFVGYLPVPKGIAPLLVTVSSGAVALFIALAFVVGGTQDDPGDGRVRGDLGRQTLSGVLQMQPYPVLHVTQGSDSVAVGETLMVAGAGKFGVAERAQAIGAAGAQITGVILNRGTIRMLQIPNRNRDIRAAEVTAEVPAPVDLGRWRLAGEICDGKCVAGAMRPGRGIAHKACADLCLLGGVPPVFVTTQPVAGHGFMMIGAQDGGPLTEALLDKVGVFVSLEGRLEERGGLAVFLADESTLKVLP